MTEPTAALIMAVIFGVCGVAAIAAALANCEWFFRSGNVRMLTPGLSRRWRRIIYGTAGVLMIFACVRLLLTAIG